MGGRMIDPKDIDIPPLSWQGTPLDCEQCVHRGLRARDGCEIGHACVEDAYARRIDRFMRWHPELANELTRHPHFEVRAIAARHADVFAVQRLANDPDETVRLQVALRLPPHRLQALMHDPHREVRLRVAHRLPTEALSDLIADADYGVRLVVARRLPLALLSQLADDHDAQVRGAVAERLEMSALWRPCTDRAGRGPGQRRGPAGALGGGTARVRRCAASPLSGPGCGDPRARPAAAARRRHPG